MSIDDYKKLINTGLKDPDKIPDTLTSVLENIDQDLSRLNKLEDAIKEKDEKIRNLQDTNIKMFLNQTSNVNIEKEDKKLEGMDYVNDFIEKLKGELEGGN